MKAVIFDMDGVLVNSEPLYLSLNREFYKKIGADISPEEYQSFIGMGGPAMWGYIVSKYQLNYTVEELKAHDLQFKYDALKSTNLVPIEGVVEFLYFLKAKQLPLGIASSGRRKNIDLILSKLGIEKYFSVIVSGEEVENGKPDPDIFLLAAKKLNTNPVTCVVVEDSKNGVTAAKLAGMQCVGFFNPGSGNQDLSAADMIFDSFKNTSLYHFFN